MAGFILTCSRRGAAAPSRAEDLRRLALHLAPDNITPNPPHVVEDGGLAWAVVNPVPGVRIRANGVCLGALFEDTDWSRAPSGAPDGTFALLRYDEPSRRARHRPVRVPRRLVRPRRRPLRRVDLAAGPGRPPRRLRARARGRELDDRVGLPGPRHRAGTADCVASPSAPACVSIGDTWKVDHDRAPRLQRRGPSRSKNTSHVCSTGSSPSAATLDLSSTPSVLTLSGGYDSRALLLGLTHAGKPPDCVTWGLSVVARRPGRRRHHRAAAGRTLSGALPVLRHGPDRRAHPRRPDAAPQGQRRTGRGLRRLHRRPRTVAQRFSSPVSGRSSVATLEAWATTRPSTPSCRAA